jgi:hypothetical protein
VRGQRAGMLRLAANGNGVKDGLYKKAWLRKEAHSYICEIKAKLLSCRACMRNVKDVGDLCTGYVMSHPKIRARGGPRAYGGALAG